MEHHFSAIFMRIMDLCHAVTIVYLSYYLFSDVGVLSHQWLFILMLLALCVLLIYPYVGLYQTWRGGSIIKELALAFYGWTLCCCIMWGIYYTAIQPPPSSLRFILTFYIWGGFFFVSYKLLFRLAVNYLRRQGKNQRNILIVADGDSIGDVIEKVEQAPWTGFNIMGTFGDTAQEGYPHLGCDDDLEAFMLSQSGNDVDEIWLAMSMSQQIRIEKLIHALRNVTRTIRYIPNLFAFRLVNHSATNIAGLSLFNVSMSPMFGYNRVLKSIQDKCLSLIILVLISPIMLVLALGIKLTSKGPIFYTQERISWNGLSFNMLKFRSMEQDNEVESISWGGAKHKKVTRIGRFMRSTSLDELPQFINVLKGDMSIVGPRPERTLFVSRFKNEIPGYMQKHLVKAGITGWAQVNGWRGDTDLHQRVEYDLYYVSNWSLWFDCKIIFLTFFNILNNAE